MTATILKPGDKVLLNDEGIDVAAGFCRSRHDLAVIQGPLTVKEAMLVPVSDCKNFQGVFLEEVEATFDNTQMELAPK